MSFRYVTVLSIPTIFMYCLVGRVNHISILDLSEFPIYLFVFFINLFLNSSDTKASYHYNQSGSNFDVDFFPTWATRPRMEDSFCGRFFFHRCQNIRCRNATNYIRNDGTTSGMARVSPSVSIPFRVFGGIQDSIGLFIRIGQT